MGWTQCGMKQKALPWLGPQAVRPVTLGQSRTPPPASVSTVNYQSTRDPSASTSSGSVICHCNLSLPRATSPSFISHFQSFNGIFGTNVKLGSVFFPYYPHPPCGDTVVYKKYMSSFSDKTHLGWVWPSSPCISC